MFKLRISVILLMVLHLSLALPSQNDLKESQQQEDSYITSYDLTDFQKPYEEPLTREQMEADVILASLPVKLPMKLNKFQKVAALNLAKAVVKPILKSKALRQAVQDMEALLVSFSKDDEALQYLRDTLDGAQQLYKQGSGKDSKKILSWFVAEMSTEETARSLDDLISEWSPTMESWIVEPMRRYFRTYISPPFSTLRERVSNFLGEGENVADNTISRSMRWSDLVTPYVNRISDLAGGTRQMLEATSEFLERQDKSRLV